MSKHRRTSIQVHIDALSNFRRGQIDDLNTLLEAMEAGMEALKYRQKKYPLIRELRKNKRSLLKYYYCSRCHGQIDMNDSFCRHCGQALKWK